MFLPAYRRRRSTGIGRELGLLGDEVQRPDEVDIDPLQAPLSGLSHAAELSMASSHSVQEECEGPEPRLRTQSQLHCSTVAVGIVYHTCSKLSCRGILDRTTPQINAPDEKLSY
jgi:hypothetical protein